jgi:hypothetical protein
MEFFFTNDFFYPENVPAAPAAFINYNNSTGVVLPAPFCSQLRHTAPVFVPRNRWLVAVDDG